MCLFLIRKYSAPNGFLCLISIKLLKSSTSLFLSFGLFKGRFITRTMFNSLEL